jgi:hypothetical protein
MDDFITVKDGVPVLDWAKIEEDDEAARRDVLGRLKRAKFDKDGRVSFELQNKLEALAQLSKLNDFEKVEGSRSASGDYERMSESELVAQLAGWTSLSSCKARECSRPRQLFKSASLHLFPLDSRFVAALLV